MKDATTEAPDHIDAGTATLDLPIPVPTLLAEIEHAVGQIETFTSRFDEAERTRFAVWDGQSPDGRKWAKVTGKNVFPWDGASDARIRIADEVINERAKIQKQAFRRAKLQTRGRESGDMATSATTTMLLDYTVRTLMADHVNQEVGFLADWRETYGLAVLSIAWERQIQAEPKTIDLESIVQMAIESNMEKLAAEVEEAAADGVEPDPEEINDAADEIRAASIDEVKGMFLDPAREAEGVEAIMGITGLAEKSARRVLRDLRANGFADYHVPYVAVNRPRWTARIPFEDVFFPADTVNIQEARWVAEVEWLAESELRSRALAEGWDQDWVDAVLLQKGKAHMFTPQLSTIARRFGADSTFTVGEEHQFEVQIVHSHYRAIGPDGLPAMFRTCWHPQVPDMVGYHEMMPYRHGAMPFVLTRRETALRAAISSRGVPDIIATHQGEIKVQRDSRADRTSLATLPPAIVPISRQGTRMPIGPGVQIPERRANEMKWMDPPRFDQGSIEMEAATRADVDRYFGRLSETVPAPIAMLHQQDMVDDFLADMNLALTQTLQLMQQFMDPQITIRVTGSDQILPVSREEIQGRFDVEATFDVRDLDTEYMAKKIEMVGTMVLPMDSSGRIDRGQIAEWAMNAIDPTLAKRSILGIEAANAKETEEEKSALAMMASGVEPIMPPNAGMNHPLRLQTLQAAVQANPVLQQRLQQDEMFAAMLQARVKFHQQAIAQEENKVIGRLGTAPVTNV